MQALRNSEKTRRPTICQLLGQIMEILKLRSHAVLTIFRSLINSHLAASLKALDVDAEVVVGVVGQGGVVVKDGCHGGGIQVARVGVHLQLQLRTLWLPDEDNDHHHDQNNGGRDHD